MINSMNLKWEKYFILLLQETGVESGIYIFSSDCE